MSNVSHDASQLTRRAAVGAFAALGGLAITSWPKVALALTARDNINRLAGHPGTYGKAMQKAVLDRAEGIAPHNRPYVFDGVGDCYGYVRQVWNAFLSDGRPHWEDYWPNAYAKSRWLPIDGGLPVATAPDADWALITDYNALRPGDVLATHQGHAWGAQWHGGLYAGRDAAGQHWQWDASQLNGLDGAYRRPIYSGFRYYYRPIHDLLGKTAPPPSSNWRYYAGPALDIGAGSGLAYTATDERIYQWVNNQWSEAPGGGRARRVAVGANAQPWVVNRDGNVYKLSGSSWVHVAGLLAQDVGANAAGQVWAIGKQEGIYRLNGSTWVKVDGAAKRIAVDPQGAPWVINRSHQIYRYVNNGWTQVPGGAKDVAIGGNGSVWVLGMNDIPHLWTGSTWTATDSYGVAIAAGSLGKVWMVDVSEGVYQRP